MNQEIITKAAVMLELAADRQCIEDEAFSAECREIAAQLHQERREQVRADLSQRAPGQNMDYGTYRATVVADLFDKHGVPPAVPVDQVDRQAAIITHYYTTKRRPSEAAQRIAAEVRGAVW